MVTYLLEKQDWGDNHLVIYLSRIEGKIKVKRIQSGFQFVSKSLGRLVYKTFKEASGDVIPPYLIRYWANIPVKVPQQDNGWKYISESEADWIKSHSPAEIMKRYFNFDYDKIPHRHTGKVDMTGRLFVKSKKHIKNGTVK